MADTKASAFTQSTPIASDRVPFIDDPGGTPANHASSLTNFVLGLPIVSTTGRGVMPKSNLNASVNPTVNNDTTEGYAVGSLWINTTAPAAFIAISVGTGAADWNQIDGVTSVTSLNDLSDVVIASPASGHVLIHDGTDFDNRALVMADVSDAGALATLSTVGTTQIDNAAVTAPKIFDLTQDRMLGRVSTGSGDVEQLTTTQVRTLINVADGATANSADATLLARANHTGQQTMSSISDAGNLATLNTVDTAQIDNDAVTYAKLQNVSTRYRLLGLTSVAGPANAEEIQVSTLTEEASPATGDWVLGENQAGTLVKMDPANFPGGGGGSQAYGAIDVKTADYTIVSTDEYKLIVMNSASAQTITLDKASWAAGEWVDIVNIGTGTLTVRAGTVPDEGINRAGVDSFTMVQDQQVRVTYRQTGDPAWIAQLIDFVTLGNSQFAGTDTSGTDIAFDLKGSITGTLITDTNETVVLQYKTPWALTIDNIDLATVAGTCSVQIRDDTTALTGFSSAVALTTSNTPTVVGDAVAAGSEIDIVITSASSLTGIKFAINFTRTGN